MPVPSAGPGLQLRVSLVFSFPTALSSAWSSNRSLAPAALGWMGVVLGVLGPFPPPCPELLLITDKSVGKAALFFPFLLPPPFPCRCGQGQQCWTSPANGTAGTQLSHTQALVVL